MNPPNFGGSKSLHLKKTNVLGQFIPHVPLKSLDFAGFKPSKAISIQPFPNGLIRRRCMSEPLAGFRQFSSRQPTHKERLATLRAAYGYTKERRIRLASFCASGNKQEFLTDLTGNRRWLPFHALSILNPFHITLPYEHIYAQAKYLIGHGFQYWFDLNDIEALETHNETFRAQENEEQLLAVYFDIPAEGYGTFMTTAEISDKLVIKGSIKKPMPLNRLGMILRQAGYQSKCLNGKVRGWLVRERDADEINANRNINARD